MNAPYSCDDVFDRLTRGAPTSCEGTLEDAKFERHLMICHECRSFAEAIGPAIESLQHAYREASSADSTLSSQVDRLVETRQPLRQENWMRSQVAWLALAAVVVVAALASGRSGNQSQTQPTLLASVSEPQLNPHGLTLIRNMRLNNDCEIRSLVSAGDRLVCCTQCHSVSSDVKPVPVARLRQACVACHEP